MKNTPTRCFFEEERTTQHWFSYEWDETIDAWMKFGEKDLEKIFIFSLSHLGSIYNNKDFLFPPSLSLSFIWEAYIITSARSVCQDLACWIQVEHQWFQHVPLTREIMWHWWVPSSMPWSWKKSGKNERGWWWCSCVCLSFYFDWPPEEEENFT